SGCPHPARRRRSARPRPVARPHPRVETSAARIAGSRREGGRSPSGAAAEHVSLGGLLCARFLRVGAGYAGSDKVVQYPIARWVAPMKIALKRCSHVLPPRPIHASSRITPPPAGRVPAAG